VALSFGCSAASQLCHTGYCYTLLMWGRVILGTVIVTLTILWLVAIWVLLLDPRTFLQKWQGGLWNSKIDGEFISVYLVSQRLCFSGRRRVAGGPSTHAHNKMCDDDHISFTESALVVRGEDGGCYAQSTLYSHRGPTAHCRLDRRRCCWRKDIRSQKLLLFRPRQWNRIAVPASMKNFPMELLPQ
jgi:hypothetical protein